MLITVLICNFSKYLPFNKFLGDTFIQKSVVLHFYWNLAWRYDVIPSIWWKQDGTKFTHNILNKKFWKIIAFDYNQHITLILSAPGSGRGGAHCAIPSLSVFFDCCSLTDRALKLILYDFSSKFICDQ